MKASILSVLAAFLIIGCTGSGNRQPVFENVQEIDVTSFDEIESSNPVEVYKTEPKYIRLNNLENAKYTFSKIEKMVIRKDLLYILDYKARRLMAFDMEGNPVKVIDYRGRGPKEYLQITDFDVDENDNIWIVDAQKDVLFRYNKECKMETALPFNFEIVRLKCLEGGNLLVQLGSWDYSKHSGTELAVSDTLYNIKSKLLYYPDYKDDNYIFPTEFSDTRDGVFYTEPVSDYLYKLSPAGEITEVYHFNFGSRTFPDKYKKNLEAHEDEFKNYSFIYKSYKITDSFVTCGISSEPESSAIMDRNNNQIAYYSRESSAFRLAGQYQDGTIWQIVDGEGLDTLPEEVQSWVKDEYDVFALIPCN